MQVILMKTGEKKVDIRAHVISKSLLICQLDKGIRYTTDVKYKRLRYYFKDRQY